MGRYVTDPPRHIGSKILYISIIFLLMFLIVRRLIGSGGPQRQLIYEFSEESGSRMLYGDEIFYLDDVQVDKLKDLRQFEKHQKDKSFQMSIDEVPRMLQRRLRDALRNVQLANKFNILEYILKNDHFNFKPPLNFLRNITNPCFLEETEGRNVTRCLPYFYFTGYPKYPRTSLWKRLTQHPQIAETDQMEPMWWSYYRTADPRKSTLAGNMTVYAGHFNKMSAFKKNVIVGDASSDTIWANIVKKPAIPSRPMTVQLMWDLRDHNLIIPQLIQYFTPNAKFILAFDNPADRMYSEYLSSPKAVQKIPFTKMVEKEIEAFYECTSAYDLRYCAYEDIGRLHINHGLYVMFVNDLMRVIPRENLLILNYNMYSKEPEKVLGRIVHFLGLKVNDDIVDRMMSVDAHDEDRKSAMSVRARELLSKFYGPFNEELDRFLDKDEFPWTASNA